MLEILIILGKNFKHLVFKKIHFLLCSLDPSDFLYLNVIPFKLYEIWLQIYFHLYYFFSKTLFFSVFYNFLSLSVSGIGMEAE